MANMMKNIPFFRKSNLINQTGLVSIEMENYIHLKIERYHRIGNRFQKIHIIQKIKKSVKINC